jgi:biopolymer transport protein ExbB/TolQ
VTNILEIKESHLRVTVALISVILAAIWILVIDLALNTPAEGIRIVDVLLDRANELYPFTIQNLMWIFFFFGLGELWIRNQRGNIEAQQLGLRLLPEDEETLLRGKDLGSIVLSIRGAGSQRLYYLQELIMRTIQQFRLNDSVAQADSLLNTSLDLIHAELDIKYNMLRYISWLLPTLGFIGTVVGISLALGEAGNMPEVTDGDAIKAWMGLLTAKLGIAFNTTLVALLQSAVLVFLIHIVQAKEEEGVNRIGRYCLHNLINRLYESQER